MLSDDGTPSLEDRLHIQDNSDTGKTSLQSPARPPLTDDQLCVLQQTVQQAMKNSRSQPSVSQDVQPFLPLVHPAGTVSPLGLHRPLDRFFFFWRKKNLWGGIFQGSCSQGQLGPSHYPALVDDPHKEEVHVYASWV